MSDKRNQTCFLLQFTVLIDAIGRQAPSSSSSSNQSVTIAKIKTKTKASDETIIHLQPSMQPTSAKFVEASKTPNIESKPTL